MKTTGIQATRPTALVFVSLLASCDPQDGQKEHSKDAASVSTSKEDGRYWCRHDSDSQLHDEEANRLVITGHPWARVGPELYDGRNDPEASITIDSEAWAVVATSGEVDHRRDDRTLEKLRSEVIPFDRIVGDAKVYKNKSVVTECYWINHGEGAWLASNPDAPLEATLSIGGTTTSWFVDVTGAELMDLWDLGPTRKVVASGTLRVGNYDQGMVALTEHPYFEPDVVIAIDKSKAESGKR